MQDKCYLCGRGDYKIIHHGTRGVPSIDVLRCEKCGLVWLSDFITNNKFYEESGMRAADKEQSISEIRRAAKKDDERRYQFIRNLIENKSLLDFGCGGGGLLHYAKGDASKVCGIELENKMREAIEKEGIKVYSTIDAAETELKGEIDIITMFHVLEHLQNPLEMLNRLYLLLKPEGRLIVEIPNANDALLSMYECKAFADFTYWEDHLYLFNNKTFTTLIEKSHFKLKFLGQIQRYPLSNTLYWLSKGTPGGHKEWSMLTDNRTNEAYGDSLAKLGIADTIIAMLEK